MKFPILIALALCGTLAQADVPEIQRDWALAMYQTDAGGKEQAFEALAERARALAAANPSDAGALIWQGIVLSTYAGEKGGLGALGLVKEARAAFEAALDIDPTALDGSAHTSLGSLYFKVPGWPIGFGSSKKAREHLLKGLALNPDGIDANFFMGEYLLEEGDKAQARSHLEKALAAPDRPTRKVADEGRRAEIRALLNAL